MAVCIRDARFIALGLAVALSDCATPATRYPTIAEDAAEARRKEVQAQTAAAILDDYARLQDLAWPILSANADLCPKKSGSAVGLTFADEDVVKNTVRGLKKSHVRAAGFSEDAVVLHAAAGGPAAKAGLVRGDRILAVNGATLPDRERDTLSQSLSRALDAHAKDDRPIVLSVLGTDGGMRQARLEPTNACTIPVRLRVSSIINAYTDGSEIIVTSSFVREVEDEALLRFVLAHELAHAGLRHPRKLIRNTFASGAFVIVPVGSVVGAAFDILVALAPGPDPVRPLGATAATKVTTELLGIDAFEREADYAGLYMYARAGGDMTGLEDVWTRLAKTSPLSTWGAITHPTTPERILALEATRAEILAKEAAGAPLTPEGLSVREATE